MEVNWKEFWGNFWSFAKKVEAEESPAANTIAFLLFFAGFGVFVYGFINHIAWAFVAGLLSLVIGNAIFNVNTALAQCRAVKELDEKDDRDEPTDS